MNEMGGKYCADRQFPNKSNGVCSSGRRESHKESDKGPAVRAVSTSCGSKRRRQPHCHVHTGLATCRDSRTARLTPEPACCLGDGAPHLSPGSGVSLQEDTGWSSEGNQDRGRQRLMESKQGGLGRTASLGLS